MLLVSVNTIDAPVITNPVRASSAVLKFDISFGTSLNQDRVFDVNYYINMGFGFNEVACFV